MKRILIVGAVVIAAISLAFMSCGNGDDGPGDPDYFTVTFDKNNTDAGSTEASPRTVNVTPPDTTVSALPTEPTRVGHIFNGWNTAADGTGAAFTVETLVTANTTVYAQWVAGYVVTFNRNNNDAGATEPDPQTIQVLSPDTTVGTLPTPPVRNNYYEFAGWNTLANGTGTEFTATTPVTAGITVFAQWTFVGGTPFVDDGVLVHLRPLLDVDGNAELLDDGTVRFATGGTLVYEFPEDADEFDYFVINRDAIQTTGNPDSQFRRINGGAWTGPTGNMNPWVTNEDWLLREVFGAGESGGFQMSHGTSNWEMRINSITFYVAPRYTVTFNFNYPGGPANLVVPDVWGESERHPGFGVAGDWPAEYNLGDEMIIDGEIHWFFGWFYDDSMFEASTPIPGDITLTARWDTEPPTMMPFVTTSNNSTGVYLFDLDTTPWSNVASVTFEALIDDPTMFDRQFRGHLMHFGATINPPATGVWGTEWGGNRFYDAGNLNGDNVERFGSDLNTWVEFTWPATAAPFDATRTGIIPLGVGFGNNTNNPGLATSYFIRNVALILDDGTRIYAEELDDTSIGWVWSAGGNFSGATATRVFRPYFGD